MLGGNLGSLLYGDVSVMLKFFKGNIKPVLHWQNHIRFTLKFCKGEHHTSFTLKFFKGEHHISFTLKFFQGRPSHQFYLDVFQVLVSHQFYIEVSHLGEHPTNFTLKFFKGASRSITPIIHRSFSRGNITPVLH